MGIAIKHPVPDRVKLSLVIFDIWALWHSALSQKIANDHLTHSGTGCFMYQYGNSGRQRVKSGDSILVPTDWLTKWHTRINRQHITSRLANACFVCPFDEYSMPVAWRLSNMTRVTSVLVRTFSLLPACFIAGLRYIAAVLFSNIHTESNKNMPHPSIRLSTLDSGTRQDKATSNRAGQSLNAPQTNLTKNTVKKN